MVYKRNKYLNLKSILSKKNKYNIHFVGIGGVSMASLAIYLKKMGHEVTGSDIQQTDNTKKLEQEGIKICYSHKAKNVYGAHCVIYSNAVERGVEVKTAKTINIPCFSRAMLLGEILKTYKTSICIAGTHGKTTTTALIYWILKKADYNVDLHLGGNMTNVTNCNDLEIHKNKKDIIVAEACEYKDSFLKLKPNIAVVTNIAPEHLDYFKTFDNVKKSFNKFALSANLLICSNLHMLQNKNKIIINQTNEQLINLKNTQATFCAKNLKMKQDGTYSFKCYKNNKLYETFDLNLIGEYNVYNALCAIAVADHFNIKPKIIKNSLVSFEGVERRFHFLNKEKFIVHDYAHHPDEINAVISQTLKFYKNKLLIVFQPHTYSRTKTLMNDFVKCFKNLGTEVVIYKTYSAREKYLKSGSAKTLAKNIGENVVYFNNKQNFINYLVQKNRLGYGILLLGAGDIYEIAKNVSKLC